jgi:hypothetical protein
MPKFPREELEQMMERWLAANRKAEREGNWRPMADLYTEDAYYCWDIPGGLYEARGREVIRDTCLGDAMDPYQGWTYPYDKIVIDETKGEVMVIWHQIPPTNPKRPDGSEYKVIGASWFQYAGGYKWARQRDLYDFGKTMALIDEVAALGLLSDLALERKRQRDAAAGRK